MMRSSPDLQHQRDDEGVALNQQVALLEQANRELAAQLRAACNELGVMRARQDRINRELLATHELTAAMQSLQDIGAVQERALVLITRELGFERAMLVMADTHAAVLSGWLCSTRAAGGAPWGIAHTRQLPLSPAGGLLALAVLDEQPRLVTDARPPTSDPQINAQFGAHDYAVLPMVIRNRPLGALIVDNPVSRRPICDDDLAVLVNIARQASVVIGSLQLCIDRTQRMAVEEERSRIAMEIHDAISQQLYGITYTLDASIKLLPDHAEEVRQRLIYLLPQAQQASAAIRRAIFDLWPDELDAERFAAELRGYVHDIAPSAQIDVRTQIDPSFDALPVAMRKQVYRVAQEALSNVIQHAHACHADITYTVVAGEPRLTIADDGQGFDPTGRRAEEQGQRHLGLISMRERAQAVGGSLDVVSNAEHGTRVTVTLRGAG